MVVQYCPHDGTSIGSECICGASPEGEPGRRPRIAQGLATPPQRGHSGPLGSRGSGGDGAAPGPVPPAGLEWKVWEVEAPKVGAVGDAAGV